jgi:hypothetical protein
MAKQKLDLVHLSVDQIRGIKQDIKELENMLKADKASGRPKIQNEAEFVAEIKKKKKLLKDHSPKELRGQNKNKAYARAKELREIIADAMPKKRDYYQRYPKGGDMTHDFDRTVRQQMAFQKDKKLKQAVQEYKHIMRRLEPDDPTISNIELLRR